MANFVTSEWMPMPVIFPNCLVLGGKQIKLLAGEKKQKKTVNCSNDFSVSLFNGRNEYLREG
jgi:hypothetical protein